MLLWQLIIIFFFIYIDVELWWPPHSKLLLCVGLKIVIDDIAGASAAGTFALFYRFRENNLVAHINVD